MSDPTPVCQHCSADIWPNRTIYGAVWFAVRRDPSGCEKYECPGRPSTLGRYKAHVPKAR